MCALLTIYEADAVFVPLNASFPIDEHRAAIEELGVSILLFSRRLAAGVDGLLRDCPSLREASLGSHGSCSRPIPSTGASRSRDSSSTGSPSG